MEQIMKFGQSLYDFSQPHIKSIPISGNSQTDKLILEA